MQFLQYGKKDKKIKERTIFILTFIFGMFLGGGFLLLNPTLVSTFVILLMLVIPLICYFKTKNTQKGKKLSDIKAIMLETQMAEGKKNMVFFYFYCCNIYCIAYINNNEMQMHFKLRMFQLLFILFL